MPWSSHIHVSSRSIWIHFHITYLLKKRQFSFSRFCIKSYTCRQTRRRKLEPLFFALCDFRFIPCDVRQQTLADCICCKHVARLFIKDLTNPHTHTVFRLRFFFSSVLSSIYFWSLFSVVCARIQPICDKLTGQSGIRAKGACCVKSNQSHTQIDSRLQRRQYCHQTKGLKKRETEKSKVIAQRARAAASSEPSHTNGRAESDKLREQPNAEYK